MAGPQAHKTTFDPHMVQVFIFVKAVYTTSRDTE